MPSDRQLIDSQGPRFRWQLAVCDGDVTAARHLPTADGSTYFTTADFGLTSYDAGEDGCSPERVVSAYCKRVDPDRSYQDLLASVQQTLGETATDRREVVA
ncbi:hypothetical protein [Natrinema thermotolerans]|uniref:hypothetical protein n=1 Tax=Natrinema thermotolerans TaxID=121872 RepID=UPI000679C55E|nr:hypothetical protein [Natrinema thermotolerans]QCC57269.1 hypothetical protein DVR14_00925 [Natrinema thermotolerans]